MRFILIDEILELTPGVRIKATKRIVGDEDYFADHFPGFPVVPGVLLTEMMAQAAGKCLDAGQPSRGKAMLARITTANFRQWVRPGSTLVIVATVGSNRPAFATAECHIELEERKICSAELLFSFVPADKFAPGYRDEVLERFLQRAHDSGDTSATHVVPS